MSDPAADPRPTSPGPPATDDDQSVADVYVGRFRLIRRIGGGGMGTVYLAEQEEPRRRVAVKLLSAAFSSPAQLRRFQDESQHLADLRHPNVAHVIDAGTQRYPALEIPYFVMEYVEGGRPITTYAEQEQLTTAQRLRLFEQVCQAVHHAHAQRLLHRDLKPANILVDMDGRVKLIDFGIARLLEPPPDGAAPTLTQPSELIGTPQYMSPEQLAPQRVELDRRSDVYALGLVLYELLCGEPPYDLKGTTHVEASRIVREQAIPRPRTRNPRLSRDLDTVILKALRKNRVGRYASAAELAEDVRRVLSGETVVARDEGTALRAYSSARRWCGRHAFLAGLLAATLLFLLALAIGEWLERYDLTGKVERVMTTRLPFAPPGPLRHVTMVVLRDDTDVEALAREQGVAGVSGGERASQRALHGRLMERLAGCGARVVAWDISFRTAAPPFDAALVQGIKALRGSGTEVVLAVPDLTLDERNRPRLTGTVPHDVPWGTCVAQLDPAWTWSLNLLVEDSANRTIPSLAMVAAAACWKPFTTWDYDLEPWQIEMGLVAAETREPQLRTLPITFTDVADADQPQLGVRAGDIVGQFFLQMPPESDLRASMLRYEDVMRASQQQLRAWFAGRAVMVGDWRTGGDVRIRHPDGRELPGFAAHAVGLDWLLSERLIRRPRPVPIWKFYIGSRFLAELCVAAVALCLSVLLGRRPLLLAIAAALLAASVLLASGITFSRAGALYPPQTALMAVLLVVVGAWLVRRWCAGSTLE